MVDGKSGAGSSVVTETRGARGLERYWTVGRKYGSHLMSEEAVISAAAGIRLWISQSLDILF
jgi:hypothetical protein